MSQTNPRNISVLAYANRFTLWHYLAEVHEKPFDSNAFGNCCDLLAPQDMIILQQPTKTTLVIVTMVDKERNLVGIAKF